MWLAGACKVSILACLQLLGSNLHLAVKPTQWPVNNVLAMAVVNAIHHIGNSYRKLKPCTEVQRLVLKSPYITSHQFVAILRAHTGAIGCIMLKEQKPCIKASIKASI